MATSDAQTSSGMGTGLVLGILVVILAIIAVVVFGGGNFLRMGGTSSGTSINVPKQVDVNVNGGSGAQQGQ
jgi:hypothetical protein